MWALNYFPIVDAGFTRRSGIEPARIAGPVLPAPREPRRNECRQDPGELRSTPPYKAG